jgi:hypothetical protein
MRVAAVLLLCVTVGLAFGSVSADPATPTSETVQVRPPQTAGAADPLDRIVCRSKPAPTGSLIGGGRVCHTQRDWDQLQTQSQRAIFGFQQRGLQGAPGGPGGH